MEVAQSGIVNLPTSSSNPKLTSSIYEDSKERDFRLCLEYMKKNKKLEDFFEGKTPEYIFEVVNFKAKRTGATLMHMASMTNNIETVRYLFRQGADVNAVADYMIKPIHLAKTIRMCRCLVDFGANVNDVDDSGNALISKAYIHHYWRLMWYLLDMKVDLTSIKRFLNLPLSYSDEKLENQLRAHHFL